MARGRWTTVLLGLGLLATAAGAQHLRVERSLPLVGGPCALRVRTDEPLDPAAKVVFTVEPLGGQCAPASLVAEGALATWAPLAPGPYRITARVDAVDLAPVEVFAVERSLHINCWGAPPTQRYVTSVLVDPSKPETVEGWRDRGVLALGWGSGALDYYERPEQWLEEWNQAADKVDGFMFDEFWGAGTPPHHDGPAGEALLQFRTQHPRLFLAPYCMTVGTEPMRRVFGQSDLVLVELYRGDFRTHPDLVRGLQPFVEQGLADRSLPVLGIGERWITTEDELRRQICHIRSEMPDCPGIGVFPEIPAHLSEAFDRAIYDHFLGPALLLRDGRLRNLGRLSAERVRLRLADGTEQTVARLWPGGSLPAPEGSSLLPGEGYTVIADRRPALSDRPSAEAAVAARSFEQSISAHATPIDLTGLTLHRAESETPEVNGQIDGGAVPLPASPSGAAGLRFSVDIRRAHYYGTVGVWLTGPGKSRLGVALCRSDCDGDLPPGTVRANCLARAEDGMAVTAVSVPGLTEGAAYELLAGWDGEATARFSLTAETGEVLWESGPLGLAGPLRLESLTLEVTPFDASDLRLEGDALLARGVSGGPLPSPYILETTLRDLALLQP